jgi:ATP adenylyltransferase
VDVLWSPWRYDYITASGDAKPKGCVFCEMVKETGRDEELFILKRGLFNFVVLNIYPYTSGHVLIVPYEHLAELSEGEKAATDEMMDLTKSVQKALSEIYTPEGINLGMNLGKAAGAGVAEHFHMHILPRWVGDVNFMTAIGQTRTLPESLPDTYRKLKDRI